MLTKQLIKEVFNSNKSGLVNNITSKDIIAINNLESGDSYEFVGCCGESNEITKTGLNYELFEIDRYSAQKYSFTDIFNLLCYLNIPKT